MEKGVLSSPEAVNPFVALSARLLRTRLDPVRQVCAGVGEGPMAGYVFVPSKGEDPAAPVDVDDVDTVMD